jgi:hypothetical protein
LIRILTLAATGALLGVFVASAIHLIVMAQLLELPK